MKSILTAILLVIATIIGVSLGKALVQSIAEPPTTSIERSEPTYMGVTKAEYLEVVSNNGQDKGAECAYTYLIDTYGLEATYKMDQRAAKDTSDVDPAIFEAIERCM